MDRNNLAFAIVVALSVGGCSKPKPVTRDAFVRAGDAVCTSARAKFAKLTVPKDGDVNGQIAYLAKTIDVQRVGAAAFRALKQPPKATDRDYLAGVLEDQTSLLTALEAARTALQSGDEAVASEGLIDVNDRSAKLREKYRAFGFSVCGRAATGSG